jgi:membrane associated rhomboid family serine protease
MELIITVAIIIVTALISIVAFSDEKLLRKTILNPHVTWHKREYHRLLTHGFLHANWTHLIVNMLTFFFFAPVVLEYMNKPWLFIIFYLSGIIIASLSTLFKHKDDPGYNSLGASGGVSAILFASVMYQPLSSIYFYGFIKMPAIVFAVLYLVYSQVMSRRSKDNINHDAHFFGAVFGIVFPIIVEPQVAVYFYRQITAIFQ